MRSAAAGRRYARALFALATESGRIPELRQELARVSEVLAESDAMSGALLTPLHPVQERKAVLAALAERLSLSVEVKHFFAYLIDKRRLVDFPAIQTEYAQLADEASGRLTAEVVSASPLDAGREARLRDVLSQRTGRNVELEVRVDPELIGGAIAKVGGLVFDGSLRTQLRQLRSNLSKSQ